jgi:hypothetical protein
MALPSFAGEIILTGTDAISLHGDASYGAQLFADLSGGSSKPVLVLDSGFGLGAAYTGAPGGFVSVTSLSGVTLSNYSGLFVASPHECCGDPSAEFAGFESAIASYVAGGGNLGVENFLGGSFCGSGPDNYTTVLGLTPFQG